MIYSNQKKKMIPGYLPQTDQDVGRGCYSLHIYKHLLQLGLSLSGLHSLDYKLV